MIGKYQNWLRRQIAESEFNLSERNEIYNSRSNEEYFCYERGKKFGLEMALKESIRLSDTKEAIKPAHNKPLPSSAKPTPKPLTTKEFLKMKRKLEIESVKNDIEFC